MPNYQLNKPWSKVDRATDCPNVFATMSGSAGSYVSDLSGAEIYALLQENPKQLILLKDINGRDCLLTTPPTSGAATLKFSVLVDTIAYIYTIENGGNAISLSVIDFSSSAGESDVFSFHITQSGGTYSMDTTWADIATAKQAGKLIVANPGGDYVYYSCGDPTDDGITLSCVYYTSTGAKMRSFTIDTDGVITYNGVTNFTADNVVKYTPQSLSSAQQAQACSNIGAANKFVVSFAFIHNAYVCDKTFSAISEAVSNNAVIEAVFGYYSGFLSYISGTEAIFVTTGLPSIPQIFTFKVTSSDVVTADSYSLDNDGVWSAEAKEALLACFEQVSWKTTYGQTYLSALETALYPEVHLVSITAAYEQDRPIYPDSTMTEIKYDLVVTAHYSDGTDEVLSDSDYTLSGTLTVGTSTITVSYQGKTDTISVLVSASPAPTPTYLYNWDLTTSLIDSVSSQEITLGAGSGKSAPTRGNGGLVFNDATQYAYLGNISLNGKTIEIDVDSFDFKGQTASHIRFLMGQVATGDSKGYGPIIWKTATGWTAYGQNSSAARTWSSSTYISGTSSDVINAFNGKTVKLVTSSDGFTHSLYLDDVLQGTLTDVKVQSYIVIGANMVSLTQANGDQCYDMTITGIRIYENEVE